VDDLRLSLALLGDQDGCLGCLVAETGCLVVETGCLVVEMGCLVVETGCLVAAEMVEDDSVGGWMVVAEDLVGSVLLRWKDYKID